MAYTTNYKNKKNKINTPLSLNTLLRLIEYALSESDLCSERNINNLYRFINLIDENEAYKSDDDYILKEYFRILKEITYYRLNADTSDLDEIYSHLYDDTPSSYISKDTIDSIFYGDDGEGVAELSNRSILFWNKFIQDKLDFRSFYTKLDDLQSLINEFKVPDNESSQESLIPKAKKLIAEINHDLNTNLMSCEINTNTFNLLDEVNSKSVIRKSLESILNPGNKITTGYKTLDRMLNGGLEGGRCYLLLGVPKGFKSGSILNIVMNVTTEYKHPKTKDPTKIPAAVYFTMENSMIETFERIYAYLGIPFNFEYTENEEGVRTYNLTKEDIEEVRNNIMEETYNRTGISLNVIYRPHRSVDTDYLYTICDDLNAMGQEAIFIAQDYIKRIRSTMNFPDARLEMGEVVNEFCKFAKEKQIPVLTASQFNREAIRLIEESLMSKKKDLSRKLNSSMTGESNLIIENADYVISVFKEFDENTNKNYLTFKLLESRAKADDKLTYFAQPFDDNDIYRGFRVETDINYDHSVAVERISTIDDANDIKVRDSNLESIKKRLSKNNERMRKAYASSVEDEEIDEIEEAEEEVNFD